MKAFLLKMVGTTFLIITLSLLANPTLAHLPKSNSGLSLVKTDTAWVLHSELNGVRAYYKISNCDYNSVVFLKFINTTSSDVKVTWDDEIKIAGEATNRRTKTFSLSLTVSPGEVAGTTCVNPSIVELVSQTFLSSDTVVEAFNFLNLTVTQ